MAKESIFSRLRSRGSKSESEAAEAGGELISTSLVAELLRDREEEARPVVLDVGAGAQCTLEFFAQYNGRIYFVDLYSCELVTDPPEDVDAAAAADIFTRHLSLDDDVQFDICLFWDALLYLEPAHLRGFSRALRPHVNDRTLGYGFGTLHSRDFEACRYGIHDLQHLEVRPLGSERAAPRYAHTQHQISEHFTCMGIQRATLLQGGPLELLFAQD